MLFRPCLPRLLFAATRQYRQAMLRRLESTIKDCPSHTRCKSSWGPFACSIVSFVALRVANMRASVKNTFADRNFHVQRSYCLAR